MFFRKIGVSITQEWVLGLYSYSDPKTCCCSGSFQGVQCRWFSPSFWEGKQYKTPSWTWQMTMPGNAHNQQNPILNMVVAQTGLQTCLSSSMSLLSKKPKQIFSYSCMIGVNVGSGVMSGMKIGNQKPLQQLKGRNIYIFSGSSVGRLYLFKFWICWGRGFNPLMCYFLFFHSAKAKSHEYYYLHWSSSVVIWSVTHRNGFTEDHAK